MKNTLLNISLLLALSLSITACGGGGGTSSSPTPTTPAPAPTPASIAAVSSSALSSSSEVSSVASNSSSSAASSSVASSVVDIESHIITEYHTTHTLSFLQNCGQGVAAPANGYSLIGDYNTAQSNQAVSLGNTWNHTTNGMTAEWANTKFASIPNTYAIPTNGRANTSCNNVDTVDILLIKKYANWDHQHANGFQPTNLKSQNINFGKIASLVIDLKVNSARTSIPTQTDLINSYKAYTAENNITGVDKTTVNLGFTLEATAVVTPDPTFPNDRSKDISTVLSASDIIDINQATFQDQWVRVVIDMSKVKFCSTANYNCTPKTAADLANTIINQLTVVAETASGNVLRGNISSVTDTQWNAYMTPKETFKELDISIKKIELQFK